MTNKNYEFFKKNFDDLYEKHKDRFVVIKDQAVLAVYDTFDEAYTTTIKTEKLGTFLIQECSDPKNRIAYFYTPNVAFY
ncbi:MAG: hypothetical protein ACOX24_07610 [Christensenellales bacterium]|jgi:hypothetical protein|nr:hypothetical protein [Clostridiales bacterium]